MKLNRYAFACLVLLSAAGFLNVAQGQVVPRAAASTTTVTVSPNPAALGQTVTFRATVTGPSGTPTGKVSFYADGSLLTSGTLNGSGVASVSAPTVGQAAGTYSITATYAGNSSYSGSTSAAYSFTLNKATPTVTVSATPNPVSSGQSVTLKATVSGADGTPTGQVVFSTGGVALVTGNVSAGVASVTVPTAGFNPGSYPIVGTYGGSSNYLSAASTAYTLDLTKAQTSTTLAATPNPVTQPADCNLSATVVRSGSGEAGTPTGSVTFKVGTTSLGSANLNASGVATLSAPSSAVSPGSYPVTAVYEGDGSDDASMSSAVTVVINPAPVAYAYTLNSPLNNDELGNISAYAEASTGELSLLPGSPFNGGLATPAALAVDQQLGLLFVAGGAGGTQSTGEIVAFTINNGSGNLSSPVTTVPSDQPSFLAVGPSGNYLYVSHHDTDTVSAYSVAANGALTEISGSPFSLPSSNCGLFCNATADELAYDADAQTLYVASNDGWIIATFTVAPSTGALTWIYNEPTGNGPNDVAITPNGQFVYTTNGGGTNNVSAFQVTTDAMSGGNPEPVTPVAGQPFAAGGGPNSVAIDPTGKYLYVTNNGDNTISAYTINSTSGALQPITGSPFAFSSDILDPQQISVDPTGKYVYVASQNSTGQTQTGAVSAFSITAGTGALVQLSNSPFSPGTDANEPFQIGVYTVKE